jgi:hypothetical protein
MIQNCKNLRRIAASVLALVCTAGLVRGQNLLYNAWDGDVEGWTCGGWDDAGVTHTVSWDGAIDAATNVASGALRIDAVYTNAGAFHAQTCKALADFTPYNAMSIDVYVAPGSSRSPSGDFGTLDLRLRTESWDWPGVVVQMGTITNTGWTHLQGSIPATTFTNFSGINLELTATFADSNATQTIWFDNLTFIKPGIFNNFATWDSDVQGWDVAGCTGWNDAGVTNQVSWDSTLDGGGSLTSGSLRIDGTFTNAGACHIQTCKSMSDFSPYTVMALDVYVATSSARTPGGDFGAVDVRLRTGNWDWPGVVVQFPAITNEGWTHFQANIPTTTATNFSGVDLEWATTYASASATHSIWVDNMAFLGFAAPPPAPIVLLERSEPGLEVVTAGSGDYSRKNIATVAGLAPTLPWINSTGAVTYAMTVNESVQPGAVDPNNPNNAYALNIMLSGTAALSINPSPDWNEPNGIFMEARATTNGTFNVDVRYKTNAPGSHGIRFTDNGLLIRTNSSLKSLVGTWALTLSNNVVWLTAPGGVAGQGALPADVPALFGPNLFALFGAQPYTFKDRKISLGRVQISGGPDFAGTVDQDFTTQGALDSSFLETKEEDPGGVHLKPTNTVWRVSWTIPDTGFQLYSSPTMAPLSWTLVPTSPINVGARRATYVESSSVSGPRYFFRLQK